MVSRKLLTTVSLAGLMAAAMAAGASAQNAPGLRGQVSSAEEGLMEGVLVSAKKDGATVTTTVVSNAKGEFSFPAQRLDPGHYTITIRAAGYQLAGPKDVTIAAYSIMVRQALAAAEALAQDGIEAEVIDLRTLRPLDTETIVQSVKKTNRLVTVEEGWAFAGIGAELAAQMMEQAFDHLDAPVARVAGKDVPLPYAANLEKLALPQPDDVVAAVKSVLYRS